MVNSIYTDKKGIYRDLYRTIEAEKQTHQTFQPKPRKGIYKDLYKHLDEEKQISFKAKQKEDKENIWHTYPLKGCAYSNDIGEAVRPIIGNSFAKLSWIPAIFYVLGAIISKILTANSNDKSKELQKEILFQLIASLLLPIIIIKSAGKFTHKVLDAVPRKTKDLIKDSIKRVNWLHTFGENFKSEKMNQYRTICESTAGLFALAVAAKPIDNFTEKILDRVYGRG